MAENGSIISDQRTFLDIKEDEFAVIPRQGDLINIPAEASSGLPALGDFEIVDTSNDGGGETTLTLRKIVATKP
jgi:hypothetical protein